MARKVKTTRNKLKKRSFYKRKGFWITLLVSSVLVSVIGFITFDHVTAPYRQQADAYDLERINDLEIPSVILDRNEKEIGRIFVQNRSVIPISEVPEIFIDALRAGEDQRFWTHDGVDYVGIVRAAWLNLKSDKRKQGASTITQQLARNAFDLKGDIARNNQTDMERKIVEAFLARRITKRYSKKQVLEFYLNRIYFGSGNHGPGYYGIRSASLGYFGKEPRDLTALESATIVGAIKNPRYTSPVTSPEASRLSRNLVLGRMPDLGGVMTREEAARLAKMPVVTNPKPLQRGTSHLYERISEEIRDALGDDGLSAGGFTIHTSIDGGVQRAMEETLEQHCLKAEQTAGYPNQKRSSYVQTPDGVPEYLQGAALMIDHSDGHVIAYVGGRNYADSQFDMISSGRRPLGTAFYPFLYAAGLQAGLTPATQVEDEEMNNRSVMVGGTQGVLAEWGMETVNPHYERKMITARKALESSKIAATVRFAQKAGLENIVKTGVDFGLPMKDAERLPRLAVGWETASLREAVSGISVFARGGASAPQKLVVVTRVDDADGHPVFRLESGVPERLRPVDDATAFQVHDIMRGGMERGSASGLLDILVEKPFTGAGKTGTTHDFSDNWFLGYNGRVSCGVWLGFTQPGKSIYKGAFSRDLAMPVWAAGMNAAAPAYGGKVIPQPESVEQVEVCRVSGQRATIHCEEITQDPATGQSRSRPSGQPEFFRAGTANSIPFCQIHSGGLTLAPVTGIGGAIAFPIDTTPVRSKAPVLLGDDPFHTEQVLADVRSRPAGGRGTNVLDNFDAGEKTEPLKLPWPERLRIDPE